MKILVLSDSHAGLSFMRYAIDAVKPDAVIHLGDYFDDGQTIAQEYPHLVFHQVGGNCDRYRSYEIRPEVLCYPVCGVKLFMVHGHNHHVKNSLLYLLSDARKNGVQAVVYGHTHSADCYQEDDGLWVMNPGACGSYGGSVGVIETDCGKITACRVLRQAELETFV